MGLFSDNFITCSVIYLSLDVIDETASHIFVIDSKKAGVNAKPHPVIPYSEVTNEIGNLLSVCCRVSVFGGILAYFHRRF